MKQTFILLFILISKISSAQDVAACIKIVETTAKAINAKSGNDLGSYLSEDFTIAGQTGAIAKMVLPRMISQLGDSLLKYEKVSETKTEVVTLVYDFIYESRGTKRTTFVFNASNQLKELVLFKANIKVMKDKTKITKGNEDVIVIPFKMAGNLILVEALLDGVKRKFIVDNGAPRLILNSKYCKANIDSNSKVMSSAIGVNGNVTGLNMAKIKAFDLNGIKVENQEIIASDLSHLEMDLKTEIYGLIGYEIYKDYDLLFDYKSKLLTLLNPEKTAIYLAAKFDKNKFIETSISMDGKGQHLAIVNVNIEGKTMKMAIDCGAEANLLDTDLFESVKSSLTKIHTDNLHGADKASSLVTTGKLKKLRIGIKDFKKVKTVFSSMKKISEGYKVQLDGIIGYEVLSRQNTLLSYVNKQLVFLE
jgi:predicted aspartyl protease